MSRQGVGADGLGRVLARFGAGSMLRLEGVMTHLFAADEADGAVTDEQLARLDEVLGRINAAGQLPDWLNVGQLGGAAGRADGRDCGFGRTARDEGDAAAGAGALWAGAATLSRGLMREEPPRLVAARARLQPVLSWKSAVVGVRTVQAGAVVGYNGTFVATEPMRLALVAVGYGDGLDRRLGKQVQLAGARASRRRWWDGSAWIRRCWT